MRKGWNNQGNGHSLSRLTNLKRNEEGVKQPGQRILTVTVNKPEEKWRRGEITRTAATYCHGYQTWREMRERWNNQGKGYLLSRLTNLKRNGGGVKQQGQRLLTVTVSKPEEKWRRGETTRATATHCHGYLTWREMRERWSDQGNGYSMSRLSNLKRNEGGVKQSRKRLLTVTVNKPEEKWGRGEITRATDTHCHG